MNKIEAACPDCSWRHGVETLKAGHDAATQHYAQCAEARKVQQAREKENR